MDDIMKSNTIKIIELAKKIFECNGNYKLICIDIDDVVYNIEPLMQLVLEQIDYRATKKYFAELSKEVSADAQYEMMKHYNILNAVLEEMAYEDEDENTDEKRIITYPKIDYNPFYDDKNLFPMVRDFIDYMLSNRDKNVFYIFLSHYNPEREAIIKTQKLSELFPEIDAVITLPFHTEMGSSTINSKALGIKQALSLDSLDNCILIDNSKTNGKDFRKYGGIDIRLLSEGFNGTHTLADHMSKVTNLDPYNLQFVLSFIKYARENPDYVKEVDIPMKVKKL